MVPSLPERPGTRYGEWTIIREVEPKTYKRRKSRQVLAKCGCGVKKILCLGNLRQGKSTKCFECSKVTHGFSNRPEYYVWDSMLARCNNPNSESYRNYGGRGVTVCSRWDPKKGGSFENFLTDMGERPDPTYHLDKEAVNMASMEYGPDTTRWVPRIENNRRKRNCRFIEFNGKRMTVSEWAQELGVNSWLIQQRLDLGWSIEKTLTMPSTRPKTRPLAKD